jgi:hypothetical protein
MNAVATYMIGLALMIFGYSSYVKYAVPVIEGPPNLIKRSTPKLSQLPPPIHEKTHLIPLLPADTWELGDCQTLFTPSGTIAFKEIEQLEDGNLKIVPFSMFAGITDPQDEQPLKPDTPTVLRAVEGAILKFDKPFNEVMQGKANMQSARLLGDVDIFRPATNAKQDDPLHILTSNVHVDKNRVYTLDSVLFAFGPHRGRGRNMTIDLMHKSDGDSAGEFSSIESVKRMELAFLEKLRIEPSPESNHFPGSSDTRSKTPLFSDSKSPLEISCEGAFVFDFESKTASFQKNVVAQQVDAFQDNIHCEHLILWFQEESSDAHAAEIGVQPESKKASMDSLRLKKFAAIGTPAVITSRSKAAKISGESLEYDLQTNEVVGSSKTDRPMTLVTPKFQLTTPELRYVVQDDQSLGPVTSNGGGHLLRLTQEGEDEFFVKWSKRLTTQSDPQNPGLQRIQIEGQAFATVGSDANIRADQIVLWAREIATPSPNDPKKMSSEFVPVEIVGNGNVRIVSPKLNGTADALRATWDDQQQRHHVGFRARQESTGVYPAGVLKDISRSSFQTRPPTLQQNIRRQGSTLSANHSPVQPASFDGPVATDARPDSTKPNANEKMNFRGREVTVRLVGQGKQTQIKELKVDGNVGLEQADASGKTGGMKIIGESLHLVPQSGSQENKNYRVFVSGTKTTMAKITMDEMELVGQVVNLDQVANKFWVEGPGSMNIKPKKKSLTRENLATESAKSTIQSLKASWKGGMIFDGSKMYLEQDVNMDANQKTKSGNVITSSSSEGLSVEFKEFVDLKQLSSENETTQRDSPDMEIEKLVMVNSVSSAKRVFKLASQSAIPNAPIVNVQTRTFDQNGKQIEQRNISVPQLSINADDGSVAAKGPGLIATHSIQTGSSKSPFSQMTRTDADSNKKGVSFIRINFDGELDANSNSREMLVRGNIRTVYTPLVDWNPGPNPDQIVNPIPGSVRLTCQSLQVASWTPRGSQESTAEMIATGNTQMQSDRFQATADRVSYREASDIITIEGTPRNDANLWFKQSPVDRNPTHLIAEKITYRIKDQLHETFGAKRLNINRN